MIALDTNVLVHAHREDSEHHSAALATLQSLALGRERFAVPWPCVHEFLAIVTHPRIFAPPSTTRDAMAAVAGLAALPNLAFLGEAPDHLGRLADLLGTANVRGPKIHDARIAAICLAHGVRELWTADRDFSYFPSLRTRNPFLTAGTAQGKS
jgi:toxin-antitoxin system PIN domain toxin